MNLDKLKRKYFAEGVKLGYKRALREYTEWNWGRPYDPDIDHPDDSPEARNKRDAFNRKWNKENAFAGANKVKSCKDANGDVIKKGDKVEHVETGETGVIWRISRNPEGRGCQVEVRNKEGEDFTASNSEVMLWVPGALYQAWRNRA